MPWLSFPRRFWTKAAATPAPTAQEFLPPARAFGSWGGWWGGGDHPYPTLAQSTYGLHSSVLMGVVMWLMRAAPEARLVVRQRPSRGQGALTVVEEHPLTQLVRKPNDGYSGAALWMSTWWSWCLDGNAYWRIVSNRGGVPQQLWWVPFWQITPEWTPGSRQFISSYRYVPEGGPEQRLSPDQVLHFRNGLDPRNPRLGLSPAAPVLREMALDDEAGAWVYSLLKNQAVPGLLITPEDGHTPLHPDQVERVKQYLLSRFSGDHRGEPMALGAPTKVTKLSWSPSEFDTSPARNTAEERISAMYGVPAAVIGYGTGLDTTRVGATMREMVGLAWSNGLVPPQRTMAEELDQTLLPRFEREGVSSTLAERRLSRLEVGWDYSNVLALQEDTNVKFDRYDRGVKSGWVLVSDARAAMNFEVTPEDRVYLRPAGLVAVPPDDQLPKPEPTPLRVVPQEPDDAESEEETEGQTAELDAAAWQGQGLERKQATAEALIHQLIVRRQRKLTHPPRALMRLVTRLDRLSKSLQSEAEALLVPVLHRMGVRMSATARRVIGTKQASLSDLIQMSVILQEAPMAQIQLDLTDVYAQLYAVMVAELLKAFGEFMDVEPMSEAEFVDVLRETAIQRVQTLNLPTQFRTGLLRVFEQGATEGWSEDQVIEAIQEQLPSGRFRTVATRARIMARTELRTVQNLASIEWAERAGLTQMIVFDALLGPTDQICEDLAGAIVTPAEGRILAQLEHPAGTRILAPAPASIVAELGVF